MALWVARTGRHGEHEQRFIEMDRIYLTWKGFNRDLRKLDSQASLLEPLQEVYPDASLGRLKNHAAQMWAFAKRMKKGDWVIVPSKLKPAIHVAELTSDYQFDSSAPDPYYHFRTVKWIAKDLPRSIFDKDLLYSFGAIQTIFAVSRNDAEARVRAMAKAGWKTVAPLAANGEGKRDLEEPEGEIDLEVAARDQIAKLIISRFKGHDLELLVEGILKAQGYTTYHSPAGPDKGIDLLAAPGPLGFGEPRLCVQVKSSDSQVDTPTLNQLIGAMQNVHADQGLLVSWGGFKGSVDKEVPAQFFRVRLWDQRTLIEQLLEHYDRLDADLRAELPLKRIWTVAQGEEGE